MPDIREKISNAYVSVPFMGYGFISEIAENKSDYRVQIVDSNLGSFNGQISCQLLASPATMDNYREKDWVSVMLFGAWDIKQGRIDSVDFTRSSYILGHYKMTTMQTDIAQTIDTDTDAAYKFMGHRNRSGTIVHDDGTVEHVTAGMVKSTMLQDGVGVNQDAMVDSALHFHRVIADMNPGFVAREHFGLFDGVSDTDRVAVVPGKRPIVYRRFVPGNDGLDKFVSTCEGAHAPFVGGNADFVEVKDGKEKVAYSKVVQSGVVRTTTEIGDDGSFVNFRVDNAIAGERAVSGAEAVTPAMLGNLFSATIGDDGGVEIKAGGLGLNAGNQHKLHLKLDVNTGDLVLYNSGKFVVSHSEADVETNSITLDPAAGIDIKADKGFRVNGKYLVSEEFVKFFEDNQAMLCQVTSIGGPAPMHPMTLAKFMAAKPKFLETGGFISNGAGLKPVMAKIMDLILGLFRSV